MPATLRTDTVIQAEQLHDLLQTPSVQRTRAILAAAKTGTPRAQTLLGQILLNGEGIEQDPQLALQWFHIAAHAQEPMAFNMLGRCYEHGWGVLVDYPQAAHYYQQSAALGLDWGQYNLANLLATGRGVEQNHNQAFALYLQAAHQNHAKSMNLVGRCYEEGLGVAINVPRALEWYQRSATAGDFRGQYSLATVYLNQGQLEMACHWFKQALATGNLNFLRTTRSALGQVPDAAIQSIALSFYQRAAELGEPSDQHAYTAFQRHNKKPAAAGFLQHSA